MSDIPIDPIDPICRGAHAHGLCGQHSMVGLWKQGDPRSTPIGQREQKPSKPQRGPPDGVSNVDGKVP